MADDRRQRRADRPRVAALDARSPTPGPKPCRPSRRTSSARRPRRLIAGSGSRSPRSFSRRRAGGRSRSSPTFAPISARASGALQPIRPVAASVSSSPTMRDRAAIVVLVGKLDGGPEAHLVARRLRRGIDDLRRLHDPREMRRAAGRSRAAASCRRDNRHFPSGRRATPPRTTISTIFGRSIPNSSSYSARMRAKPSGVMKRGGASAMARRYQPGRLFPKIARDVHRRSAAAAPPRIES